MSKPWTVEDITLYDGGQLARIWFGKELWGYQRNQKEAWEVISRLEKLR